MTVNPHPIDLAIPDNARVDKAALRAYEKQHKREVVADSDTVRATDYATQFAGLFITDNNGNYDLDNERTDPDDGFDVIIDGGGSHWIRQSVLETATQREYVDPGDIVLDSSAPDTVLVNKTIGEATDLYLPDVAAFKHRRIRIVDRKYDANTHAITVHGKNSSGQLVMGAASFVMDAAGMSLLLEGLADGTGWV